MEANRVPIGTITSNGHRNDCDLVGWQQGYAAPPICSCDYETRITKADLQRISDEHDRVCAANDQGNAREAGLRAYIAELQAGRDFDLQRLAAVEQESRDRAKLISYLRERVKPQDATTLIDELEAMRLRASRAEADWQNAEARFAGAVLALKHALHFMELSACGDECDPVRAAIAAAEPYLFAVGNE